MLENYLQRHPLVDEEADSLRDTLHNMMKQEDVAKFFDPAYRSLNECNLVCQGVVSRPDRIVFTPSETWVIDFKTGSPRNEHRDQVSRYCQAIAAITHSLQVKGYLLYIGPDHCQVLPCQ